MNNVKVTKIEFLGGLLPRSECRYSPFCSTQDVCADDLPSEMNQKIWEELNKGRDVVPVKMTINVNITGMNIADDVADEVMAAARRTLKSVEYLSGADRGAVTPDSPWYKKQPYVFAVKASPLSVIEALTTGHSYNVKIIGFLTREK